MPLPAGPSRRPRLTVCVNDRGNDAISPSCGPRGGQAFVDILAREIADRGLDWELRTINCLGLCDRGPNVRLVPGNNWFYGVSSQDASELLDLAVSHMQPLSADREPRKSC